MTEVEVVLEVAPKRSFACALWLPGWFGHGKTPEAAIERMLDYRDRYAPIAARAKRRVPADPSIVIAERLVGDSTTDFGAPSQAAACEWDVPEKELRRLREVHGACVQAFMDASASAPEELRKGPRGGGRDTSKVVDHVANAEAAYASKLRRELCPEAYYLRRSAYHYTDHVWEIEDRTP